MNAYNLKHSRTYDIEYRYVTYIFSPFGLMYHVLKRLRRFCA